MKRLILSLAVVLSSFALAMPHPTLAAGCINGSGSFVADGTSHSIGNIAVPANDTLTLTATNNSGTPYTVVTLNTGTATGGNVAAVSYSSPQPTTITGAVEGTGGGTVYYSLSDNGSGGCPGPWFNPGDGRIPGWPGDRITAWCNTKASPPNIDVWGILPDSTGTRLYQFPIADIVNAGAKGITMNIGALGTVFISGDSYNNYTMAWSGGPAGATGAGDFAKTFNCGS